MGEFGGSVQLSSQWIVRLKGREGMASAVPPGTNKDEGFSP